MSFLTAPQVDALLTLRQHWDEGEIVIVGATAVRYHLNREWRETRDLDLSIMTSVEGYADVLTNLPGWAQDSRMEQRWFAPNETQVDIIPASNAVLAADELIWPSGFRMNLAGFGLAFDLGERVALGAEVAVFQGSTPSAP